MAEVVPTDVGLSAEVRGVESLSGDAREAAQKAASAFGVTVAASGDTDYVSDGERVLAIENGHLLMGCVVGLGCASTAVVGCFAAAGGGIPRPCPGPWRISDERARSPPKEPPAPAPSIPGCSTPSRSSPPGRTV